jgi:hypothetical protein
VLALKYPNLSPALRIARTRLERIASNPFSQKTAQLSPERPAFAGWTATSYRELAGHCALLGIDHTGPDVLSRLRDAELERAVATDLEGGRVPRVKAIEMDRAVARAAAAERLVPRPQVNLFGFTRLIDARFTLDPETIAHLADRVQETGADLLGAIDRGPGDGATAWKRPENEVELVASLTRHLALGGGGSLQLRLSHPLAHWLEDSLRGFSTSFAEAIGGAGGFSGNVASVFPNVTANFFSLEDVPRRLGKRFGAGVNGVDLNGDVVDFEKRITDAEEPRVNYAAEYPIGPFSVLGHSKLMMNGVERELMVEGRGRMILGTPGTQRATFGGMPRAALEKIARAHDMFFMVGTHYHTEAGEGAQSEELASQLSVMKAANPKLFVHLQYVVPKVAENEHAMLEQMRGRVDSMSLNAVEVAGLLGRMSRAGMSDWRGDEHPVRDEAEKPATVLDGADALKKGMRLSRVHVHGSLGDVVIVDRVKDPERQVLALLRARQVASMKAANETGEITSPADVFRLAPIVEGRGLAAVHDFADAISEKFGPLSAKEHAKIVERWWWRDPNSGEYYFFVPSRGIHDSSGGTISLGDTIDVTALVFGMETEKARPLLHPRSFNRANV